MGPTQQDVARRAKVSRALVSLVMRDAANVSPASRRKVLRAAAELGYRPNAFARSLASKRIHTIGVLVNDVRNPYFGGLYAALAKAAYRAGYDILTAPGTRSASAEIGLVNTLLEHRVAGLALLSPLMPIKDLRAATAAHPAVIVGREVSLPGVDVVTTDEDQAATSVITRLHDLGHRDIAHITGGGNRSARDRAAAYRRVMNSFGLTPHEVSGSFTEEGGRAGAARLLAEGAVPTALVAANDLIAVGAIGALHAAGLRVPEDVSVVGYDDSQVAQLELVQLTSVHQPIDEFGEAAIATLVHRIENPDRERTVQRIATRLVNRRTVGQAPAASKRR